jgi:hypothetical protein
MPEGHGTDYMPIARPEDKAERTGTGRRTTDGVAFGDGTHDQDGIDPLGHEVKVG